MSAHTFTVPRPNTFQAEFARLVQAGISSGLLSIRPSKPPQPRGRPPGAAPKFESSQKADAAAWLVMAIVAKEFGTTVTVLKSRTRTGPIARARMVGMYLMLELLQMDSDQVAACFERERHAVNYSRARLKEELTVDSKLSNQLDQLIARIRKAL